MCNFLLIREPFEIAGRSAILATVNLALFLVNIGFNGVTGHTRLVRRVQPGMFWVMACMTLFQGAIHSAIHVLDTKNHWGSLEVCAYVVRQPPSLWPGPDFD
jgi:hypothetical protein